VDDQTTEELVPEEWGPEGLGSPAACKVE